MKETYFYTNDCGLDMLIKKVEDPEEDKFTGYIWNPGKGKWVENWQDTAGYFYGFDPAEEISEERAKAYIANHQEK